jgi:ubiquinone/menaquinone biosynthesis C-methylase UbiE
LEAIAAIPAGSHILDLPCGAGRLVMSLVERGYRVTAADSSPHMISVARDAWREATRERADLSGRCQFDVQDVMHTNYEDRQFDAVICNRLLHHFRESETRIAALKELRRITKNYLIASFFRSFALDAFLSDLVFRLRGKVRRHRVPISLREFEAFPPFGESHLKPMWCLHLGEA